MSRLFIAISLPQQTLTFLKEMQRTVRQTLPNIRASWPKAESMHLTLKFLGDTPHDQEGAIQSAMLEASRQQNPFQLHAGGCGVFPSVKHPQVVWSGVKGETEALFALFSDLEMALLQNINISNEKRRFSPHFTLARIKGRHPAEPFVKLIQRGQHHQGAPFQCKAIHLFKSDLAPSGALHTRLFSAPLGTSKS